MKKKNRFFVQLSTILKHFSF